MDPIRPVSMPGASAGQLKLGLLLLLGACATAPHARRPAVPENLRVPEGQRFLLRAVARGAQIYTCKAKATDPAAFEWALKAPEAELFDEGGARIGHHSGGPTWEALDGSRVVGEVEQRSPAQNAVPWLLLHARSHEGTGTLAAVQYIQRLDTDGGVAPSAGCDAAHAGEEARIDYSANYDFYGSR